MAQPCPLCVTDVVVMAPRTLGAALACAVVAALCVAMPAAAGSPVTNVVAPVDYWPACWPDATTAACDNAVLADIAYARALEGVGPMVLPTHFAGLDPGRQVFVITNLERSDRGLRPIAGLSTDLDAVAAAEGVAAQTHPVFASSHVGPMTGTWWTGVWAGAPQPPDRRPAVDVRGRLVGDGHHERRLRLARSGRLLGPPQQHPERLRWRRGDRRRCRPGGTTGTSIALVSVGGKGLLPPLRYLWSDALADGAGGPAAVAALGTAAPGLDVYRGGCLDVAASASRSQSEAPASSQAPQAAAARLT